MADLKQLGKYKVVEVIGKGAMGVVYKGYDPVIERHVALKTVRKELVDENLAGQIIARFKNEALASGRLNHPAIVGIYDYGENKQLAYIAMEYVQGRGLRDFLARQERFGLQDVMSIMSRLLDALHYAHEHGVVHRDIKPQNIIMTPDGRLKVADFGIARIDRSNLTQVGSVMGTPAYMSPEQYAGQQVDRRSDVFSCGVVLYELLTGVKPFEGPTETVGYKICHEPHRNPSEINPQGVPEVFDAILAKALAKKAEDRYASAREFAEALAKGFESRGSESAPTEATLLPTIIHQDRRDTTFPPPGWAAEPLRELEELLAPYVGPMARVLVRRSAKTTTDGPALVRLLAEKIPSERDAKAFAAAALEKVFAGARTEAAPDRSSPNLSNKPVEAVDIDKAAGQLAPYVGPIAKVMVKKAAAQARDLKAFYQRLAENLDPEDRARFLKDAGYEP
ncbi:MAG TPA: serine/threonine-protein kinase [Burkholderiales bacterium]|nr:serine/threonine-protein kinase [Burkholderiales bacterium]